MAGITKRLGRGDGARAPGREHLGLGWGCGRAGGLPGPTPDRLAPTPDRFEI